MIRTLRIRSFKAFSDKVDTSIPLEPITLFVGPNGAGKSTILQAVAVLGDLVRGNIEQLLEKRGWEYRDLPHLLSGRQTIAIGADIDLGKNRLVRWELTLGRRLHPGIAGERIVVLDEDEQEQVLVNRTGRTIQTYDERGNLVQEVMLTLPSSWLSTVDPVKDAGTQPTLAALATWARGIRSFFFLDPTKLRAASRTKNGEIGEHGEDLAAYIGSLAKRPRALATLTRLLKKHYPRLSELTPKSNKYGWTRLEVAERWNGETAKFNARQVSDGLLRLIAVATLIVREDKPSVLLFDEIDNGLHPRLLEGFVSLLTVLSKDTQVLATTHNPISLNYVSDESAIVVTRGAQGTVRVTRVVDTPGFADLREHFALGELWYNVGEERIVKSKSRTQARRTS
jgi:predicted ATPase